MPSRRFWSMEQQINRIKASDDLREMNIGVALTSKDGVGEVTERLVLELGETTQVEHQVIVRGERNRAAKFAKVM